MGRRPISQYGVAPRERLPAKTPEPLRRVPQARGHPKAQGSASHGSRAPKPRGVGSAPDPRTPKLVRDVNGGSMGDLFQMFPDLPWPRHKATIVPLNRDAINRGRPRRALKRRVR